MQGSCSRYWGCRPNHVRSNTHAFCQPAWRVCTSNSLANPYSIEQTILFAPQNFSAMLPPFSLSNMATLGISVWACLTVSFINPSNGILTLRPQQHLMRGTDSLIEFRGALRYYFEKVKLFRQSIRSILRDFKGNNRFKNYQSTG